ncbi:MAG: phosphoribosylformylglycinamidine cyclo-ligase [Candidatus Theseobacter exili]|nr:phosphoribosylformylglycinamidine cyclo-ligase [Candidatus Theseobacter exili]
MKKNLTYQSSGVDIKKADLFLHSIIPMINTTRRPEVVGSLGSFSGFFRPSLQNMKDPLLVAATDGVGTKLLVANQVGKHDTIGIDLVAMCVNDIITCGAEPLFFLDYIATGSIHIEQAKAIISGITKGCRQSNCSLIGGETAEMPGLYEKEHYDLAGFCVGIVDKSKVIDGKKIKSGNLVLGLESSGLHSNGYSLARKVFTEEELEGKAGKTLLKPTRVYVKPILDLHKKNLLNAVAHITGGGLLDNIPRVLPKGYSVEIDRKTWKIPGIFREIQKRGQIEDMEMFHTFNMGIGMTIIITEENIAEVKKILQEHSVRSSVIGQVIKSKTGTVQINGSN